MSATWKIGFTHLRLNKQRIATGRWIMKKYRKAFAILYEAGEFDFKHPVQDSRSKPTLLCQSFSKEWEGFWMAAW